MEGYHKLLTWDILSYGIPRRVFHHGARRVLNLTGILPEASYGFNFHTLFYSPLCSWKSVLICRKSERSINACLLPQQRVLQPGSQELAFCMPEDMASVLGRSAGILAAQTLFFDMWYPQMAHTEETNVHYITKQDCLCVLDSGVCIGLSK